MKTKISPSIFLYFRQKFISLYDHIKDIAIENTEYASNTTMTVSVIIGIIFYPAFYVVWKYILPEPYESFLVRFIAVILFLGLMFRDKWPERFKKWLPLYWHASLTYGLPFFQTYLLLMNNFSATIVAAQGIAFFIIVILFIDWVIIILMYSVGILAAWACYVFMTGDMNFFWGYVENSPLMIFAMTAGFLLNYTQNVRDKTAYNEKVNAMFSAGTYIAHELRTPLSTIRNNMNGINEYFPKLISNNKILVESGIEGADYIDANKINQLKQTINSNNRQIEYSHAIINAILINTNLELYKDQNPSKFPIKKCINLAIQRYPFKPGQKELIHAEGPDFQFNGFDVLVNQILQNLLRNAFFYIKKSGKGEIFFTTEEGESYNYLYFKDTGEGIKPNQVKRVFNRFYTTRFEGTGIGLSFCKEAMINMEGNITCSSIYGQYTEFTLSFPKIG